MTASPDHSKNWIMRRQRRTPPGSPPGTLTPDPNAVTPVIRVIAYSPTEIEERPLPDLDELPALLKRWPVTWVNVDGLGDLDLVRRLGDIFKLHGLALEDAINVHQRPKVEEYDDHIFLVTRMARPGPDLSTEQMSMFLGENYLLTFQERPGDGFDPVRERLRKAGGRIRQAMADYLAYALLDAAIDQFFPIVERCGELLEELEDAIVAEPSADLVPRLHALRRDFLNLRRVVWPQRDMINALARDPSPLIADQTRIHLRDCYDHTIQLMDLIETDREIAGGLIELYLSQNSAKMNEVMKLLTVIATIFIPLGFVAGLYGMNFDTEISPWNMPELRWPWGYPFALGIMSLIAIGLLTYFRRRGWIGNPRQ